MSSTLLDANRISRHHGARTVLESVDFRLTDDQRIALVGPNGSGKSTLLRVLAGLEAPDEGTVRRHGTVGYLPRVVPEREAARTARELILERIGVAAAGREVDRLAAELERGNHEALGPHAEALERWASRRGRRGLPRPRVPRRRRLERRRVEPPRRGRDLVRGRLERV